MANEGTMVVTYSSLDEAASTIEKQAKRLDTSLELIQDKIRLISDTFEGEAKAASDRSHRQWDSEARAIYQSLTSIAKAVREAAPAYQAGDKKAAGYF
ncbi:WXG100 family type VII secretion target [Streptomyces solincola]|uniref:ESAT-6-like protein n=1 Tax=Streptomyces solincola TaxID=2100817 RepID=A0A2S9PPT6_9ACTN|nr:WXG100 family type VII secretion target [Streptomyces solincola]PRH76429.1 WXG100 family type VII secretion target [Streptomyces solincola]